MISRTHCSTSRTIQEAIASYIVVEFCCLYISRLIQAAVYVVVIYHIEITVYVRPPVQLCAITSTDPNLKHITIFIKSNNFGSSKKSNQLLSIQQFELIALNHILYCYDTYDNVHCMHTFAVAITVQLICISSRPNRDGWIWSSARKEERTNDIRRLFVGQIEELLIRTVVSSPPSIHMQLASYIGSNQGRPQKERINCSSSSSSMRAMFQSEDDYAVHTFLTSTGLAKKNLQYRQSVDRIPSSATFLNRHARICSE